MSVTDLCSVIFLIQNVKRTLMNELTAFQRDLLYIIQNQGDPNGLEIKEAIQTYYEEKINHGRLYPNLDQLADAGLISKGEHDKRTNKYEITQRGQQTIRKRMRWERERAEELVD